MDLKNWRNNGTVEENEISSNLNGEMRRTTQEVDTVGSESLTWSRNHYLSF